MAVTGEALAAVQRRFAELQAPAAERPPPDRIRRPGGGRKRVVDTDPTLRSDLERLVDPVTRGDPDAPLRWTSKSVRMLAADLGRMGHRASRTPVATLLHDLGY